MHIKSFVGTSEDAVEIQIRTARIIILILKALESLTKYNWNLSNLVAFISLNLFVEVDLQKCLDEPFEYDLGLTKLFIQGFLLFF